MKRKNKTYRTRKNQSKMSILQLIILISILMIVAIVLIIIMKIILIPKQKEEEYKNQINNEVKAEAISKDITSADYQLTQLKKGTERDRIEYYCGQFFKNIENKNYEKAYELLYSEFKQQYFPTIEEFTKYVQKTYPSILAIKYDDFDRQGDIYITTVIIDDALATNNKKQFSQRIVVQESDYNEYVLSFQVI